MNIKKAVGITAGIGAGVTGGSLYLDRPADKTKEFENKIQMMSDEAEKKDQELVVVKKESEDLKSLIDRTIKYPYEKLSEDITSLVIDYDKLGREYIDLKKKYLSLTIDANDLLESSTISTELSGRTEKCETKIDEIKSKLDAATQEKIGANRALEDLKTNHAREKANLQSQINDMTTKFNDTNRNYADLVTKYQELQKQKGTDVKKEDLNRIQELEGLLEKAKQEAIDKGKELAAKIKELADTALEKEKVEEEASNYVTTIQTLQEEVRDLTAKLDKSGDTQFKKALEDANKDLEALKKRLSDTDKQLEESKKQLDLSKQENEGLKASVQKISDEMTKVEKEKSDLQDRYDEQTEELETEKALSTSLSDKLSKSTQLNTQGQSQVDTLKKEIAEHYQVLDENADLNVRLDGKTHRLERVKGDVDRLKSENKSLTDRNNNLETMVRELQDKLNKAYDIIKQTEDDGLVDHLNSTIRRQGNRHNAYVRGVDHLLGNLARGVDNARNTHYQMASVSSPSVAGTLPSSGIPDIFVDSLQEDAPSEVSAYSSSSFTIEGNTRHQ